MSMADEEKRSKLRRILAKHFPFSHNIKDAIVQVEALFKQEVCIDCSRYDPEDPADFCGYVLGATFPVSDFDPRVCWCRHFEEKTDES